MAGTKARRPTAQAVSRWINAGYGQGDAAAYRPFMYIRDVPSSGASNTLKSRTTGRIHHYLSRLELRAHVLAEYSSNILDIREQFALLPWEETQSIASSLGISHPKYPGTHVPTVLTTDLLLSMRRADGTELVAVSIKHSKNLSPRALEKLLLERTYWNRRGIRWVLETERTMPAVRASNLLFFETALNDSWEDETTVSPEQFNIAFEKNHHPESDYNSILKSACALTNLDTNTGHALLGRAIWDKRSRIDIDRSLIKHRSPVHLMG